MSNIQSNYRKENRIPSWITLLLAVVVVADFWASSSFPSCEAFMAYSPTATMMTMSSRTTTRPKVMLAYSDDKIRGGDDDENDDDYFENVAAAVIVPGFLTGAEEFQPLCDALTAKGIPVVAVPMPNWHWLPCLGGRSARPILERIDFTIKHLVANLEKNSDTTTSDAETNNESISAAIHNIPSYKYSWWDCYQDFRHNPGGVMKVGGSSNVEEYAVVQPMGDFPPPENFQTNNNNNKTKKKIALIGHSAGGWISRVYLSSSEYGGRAYAGSKYVHSLVTLGTPHSTAPGPAFDGIKWINDPSNEIDRLRNVRSLGVAGNGFRGGDWGGLTLGSYGFCCPDGTDGAQYEGDGVTPVFSALGMPESESLVLEKVTHFCWSDVFGGDLVAPELTEDHKNGGEWYGSEGALDQWAKFIQDAPTKHKTVDKAGIRRMSETRNN